MRTPAPYDVVQSLAGHDAGRLYMVIGQQGQRLLLCDGRLRKMQVPKTKSPKHVRFVAAGGSAPAEDKDIRHTLSQAAAEATAKEGKLLGER